MPKQWACLWRIVLEVKFPCKSVIDILIEFDVDADDLADVSKESKAGYKDFMNASTLKNGGLIATAGIGRQSDRAAILLQSGVSMLKGFLGGGRAVPPLANVGVSVTVPTRAQHKYPGSRPMDWLNHQSYAWNVMPCCTSLNSIGRCWSTLVTDSIGRHWLSRPMRSVSGVGRQYPDGMNLLVGQPQTRNMISKIDQ
uniref:Uncharacterized protein n=1 Tax=Romanomermis culicivorax TaxID=13658 RepID=A0A915K3I1_ROMCU